MKLRIRGDSLRLRLTRSEVARMVSEHEIGESMHLSGATLTYILRSDTGAKELSAELAGTNLTVVAPAEQIKSWADSEQVSLQGQDGPLQILIEKDFACLRPHEGEDNPDAFPNPDQHLIG